MSDESWRFRTTRGVVTVDGDAIRVRSTPRYFLSGQLSRWRHGGRWERAKIAVALGGFLSSMLQLLFFLVDAGGPGHPLEGAPYVVSAAIFGYVIWSNHVGETTIPLSAVDAVTLDDEAGELTVHHDSGRGPTSAFGTDDGETTLTLPTRADRRDARGIFRLRGVDLLDPEELADDDETVYRVHVRDGATFCERCESQVSPSDGTCPACGYAIRVTASEAEDREPATEASGSG